jgi:hypothetical protein
MSAFTDDMQRRLRAVLSLRVQAPLPSTAVVLVEATAIAHDDGDDRVDVDADLVIRTEGPPHARYSYEEPGAWGKLLADLEAVAEPAKPSGTPPFTFVQVEQITPAAPTQWFAWDALGAKYYLRFGWGKGTVEAVYSTGSNYTVREFYHGGSSAITLEEFAQLAGIDVSQIPEEQRR